MANNKLIKYDDSLIKRVDNSISITNKLLNINLNHSYESISKNKILAMQKLKKLVNQARTWSQEEHKRKYRNLDNETNQE